MPTIQGNKRKRRRYAIPVGGLFLLLAAVGLLALIMVSIQLTRTVLDNSREKQKLEDIIRPVLMFDPVPFETPEDIDPTQLLYYSMWAALSSERGESYGFDENQELVVPASDLDVAAANLFGQDMSLAHKTFGDYETRYYYDAERNIYNVPVQAQLFVYSPRVETIEKVGDQYHLKVGYIPPTGAWTANLRGQKSEPEPDKYMIYAVKKAGDTYHIVAVRDPAGAGIIAEPSQNEAAPPSNTRP